MNLASAIRWLFGYGTSEGVTKAWDTRGRGKHLKMSVKLRSGARYDLYEAYPAHPRMHKGYFGHVEQTRSMPSQVVREEAKQSQYQKGLPTTQKSTGTKWMDREHDFKGYFHATMKGVNALGNSHVTMLEGPGKEGGTVVTVSHQSKMLGAPNDRLHVKEQDTDEYGNLWRTRQREFVRVQDGLRQVNARYGVKL